MRSVVLPSLFAVLFAMGCASSGDGNGGPGPETPECEANQNRCAGNTYQSCSNGAWSDVETCTTLCTIDYGCVQCSPGSNSCDGNNNVVSCDSAGNVGGIVETCTDGLICAGGGCVDACEQAAETKSYIGCEYYAVDLDNAIEVMGTPDPDTGCTGSIFSPMPAGTVERNDIEFCHDPDNVGLPPLFPPATTAGLCEAGGSCPNGYTCETAPLCVLDAQNSPFAIVVSNPQNSSVNLTLSNQAGQTEDITLAAGEVLSIAPQSLGFEDQSINGSGIGANAYRIVASAPIVAYQFNPLDNVDVFSNDGSLLIPRHAYDTKYYAMSLPSLVRRPNTNDYNGYMTVVAWADNTEVTVTPKAGIRAGTNFDAIAAGATKTFTLNQYETLSLEAVGDGDITGSLIEATGNSIGVFAGHEAVVIQNTESSCCADHIEEMMFPASTWGKDYVVARSQSRGMGEPDMLRIVAQKDGTQVSFNPAPSEGSCSTLSAGQHCDVKVMGDIQVTATEPILVGHYLLSVIESGDIFAGPNGSGDPAMALAVPFEQYRRDYTFLVPDQYDEQFISVVANTGGEVILDGVTISGQLTGVGSSGVFSAGRIEVGPGQHTLSCPGGGCGIEVYGYSDAVSYLFAGGLDLQRIVTE